MSAACRAPRTAATTRRAAQLTVGAAAAALVLTACSGGGVNGNGNNTNFVTSTGGISTVKKGDRSDAPVLTGKDLNGKRMSTADYKGKVLVVNIWGSWCSPCRAEAKYFSKVSEQTKDKDVQFIGINTRDARTDSAINFEKDYGITYPSFYDPSGKLLLKFKPGTLNPQGIPNTIVIDRDGKLAARSLKALNATSLHEMIDPVIAEK
ncbi:TlpA disulfide reductase family protein [Streptomyces sp. VRA16 Mangrove soil]|uniref:TlpA family protein disulfide reductase n=1 Tax=Streptomyces sp. VRA16 Mangrove soil TaxID=2817434 RepID=UPI001A9E7ABF|nr:TlpA disulfide reductase family protein [Streptomyces sp. VRA16 Mangrove soil]MBO1337800.1 TlpA family protein disulfide reductase [Streptomyces sp. VRA16 Mangrove soil]